MEEKDKTEKSPESKKNDKKEEENNDYELLEKFMNLPFTIKSSDKSDLEIQRYYDFLNEIPRNKLQIKKENKSIKKKLRIKKMGA